jgi:hypothetical protein
MMMCSHFSNAHYGTNGDVGYGVSFRNRMTLVLPAWLSLCFLLNHDVTMVYVRSLIHRMPIAPALTCHWTLIDSEDQIVCKYIRHPTPILRAQ